MIYHIKKIKCIFKLYEFHIFSYSFITYTRFYLWNLKNNTQTSGFNCNSISHFISLIRRVCEALLSDWKKSTFPKEDTTRNATEQKPKSNLECGLGPEPSTAAARRGRRTALHLLGAFLLSGEQQHALIFTVIRSLVAGLWDVTKQTLVHLKKARFEWLNHSAIVCP